MTALIDALKAKYRSPGDALRALGLDARLLHGVRDDEPAPAPAPNRRLQAFASQFNRLAMDVCRAKDQGSPGERLHAFLRDKLSPEELAAVGGLLEAMMAAEEEGEEEERAEIPDEYEADETPEGRRAEELDGVVKDKISRVPSIRKIKTPAMDEATRVAFEARFPAATRIATDGGLFAAVPDLPARPTVQSAARRADFDARFPALKRVAS